MLVSIEVQCSYEEAEVIRKKNRLFQKKRLHWMEVLKKAVDKVVLKIH
jgi:hypothetical protein